MMAVEGGSAAGPPEPLPLPLPLPFCRWPGMGMGGMDIMACIAECTAVCTAASTMAEMSGGGGGGGGVGRGRGRGADGPVWGDGEGGVGISAVGLEEATEVGHNDGEVVAGVDVGAGGRGSLGALVVGADEATAPRNPGEGGVGIGDDGEVEGAAVEGGVDRGGNTLHDGIGVEGVATGEGGGVEDAERAKRRAGGEDAPGGEGEGERCGLQFRDRAGLGAMAGEPDVEGEGQQGEDAEEGLQRVQVEDEDTAVNEGRTFGVEALAEVEGGLDAGLTGEGGLHLRGGPEDVVAGFVGAGRAGGFGEDGCGEGRGRGGEVREFDGSEEGRAGEAETAADAREDRRGVGDRLGVGEEALDVGLFPLAVAVEGGSGGVVVGGGIARSAVSGGHGEGGFANDLFGRWFLGGGAQKREALRRTAGGGGRETIGVTGGEETEIFGDHAG